MNKFNEQNLRKFYLCSFLVQSISKLLEDCCKSSKLIRIIILVSKAPVNYFQSLFSVTLGLSSYNKDFDVW